MQDAYAERLQFEEEEEETTTPAAKRQRTDNVDTSDGVLDAETAWAIGFTPHSVTSEEEDLLPLGADEGVYTKACLTAFDGHTIWSEQSMPLPSRL